MNTARINIALLLQFSFSLPMVLSQHNCDIIYHFNDLTEHVGG